MGQGQRILHLSNSADTNNYIYDTVVVGANSTVRLNGIQYAFSGGTVVKMVVRSVELGNSKVYLGGYLTTFMFPSYLGNPGGGVVVATGDTPVIIYTLDAYDQCFDGTPAATQVYSTSSSFIMGAVIYTDIGLTTPYANQIFGSNIGNLPCTPANVGTQTDSSGTIVSTTAEIGGCC